MLEWIALFVLGFLGWRQGRKIEALKSRLDYLSAQLHKTRSDGMSTQPQSEKSDSAVAVEKSVRIEPTTPLVPLAKPPQIKRTSNPSKLSGPSIWERWESAFAAHWTGVSGSIVMVLGVGFLGVYAALNMSAVMRVALICGLSALLFWGYWALRSNSRWSQYGHWLGSAAVAIFLFACLGSGGIPGLQWVTDPTLGVSLLLLGIAANFGFAFLGSTQVFASLHTILAMIACSFYPNEVTLFVAMTAALAAISFSYRYRWDVHLILTIASFLGFLIFWKFSIPEGSTLSTVSKMMGMGAVAVVALAAGLVHYRKDYETKSSEPLPILAHTLNWIFAATGFFILEINSHYKTFGLAIAGIAAFFLARHGRRMGIQWLYQTDTLISQSILLLTLISLAPWGAQPISIACMVFVQFLAFSWLMRIEGDRFLQEIASALVALAFFPMLGLSLDLFWEHGEASKVHGVWASLFAAFTALAYLGLITKRLGAAKERVIESFVGGLLPIIVFVNLLSVTAWSASLALGLIALFMGMRRALSLNFLGGGTFVSLLVVLIGGWIQFYREPLSFGEIQLYLFSFLGLVISVLGARSSQWFRTDKAFPDVYLYVFGIQWACSVYFIGEPYSALLPGILWLLSAPIFLEIHHAIAQRPETLFVKKAAEALLRVSYGFLVLFLIRHVFYHLQVEDYWAFIKLRAAIEILGIVVFGYFLFSPSPSRPSQSWIRNQPLFLEIVILSIVGTVVLEVDSPWVPLIWCVSALVMFFLGNASSPKFNRLRTYSLPMAWAGAIHVAAVTSTTQIPDSRWYLQPWLMGTLAFMTAVIYLISIRASDFLESDEFPDGLRVLKRASLGISTRKHLWVYYPFFVAMGIFAYWRFDQAVLTFVCVVLSFIIFSIAIIHKVAHFRFLALCLVGLCMVRLALFDLSQAGTLTRGLVFLGVGAIMMLMNAVYLRFNEANK